MRRLELVSVTGEVIALDGAPYWTSPNVAMSGMPRVAISSRATIGSGGRRVDVRQHTTRDVRLQLAVVADSADEHDEALSRLARAIDPAVGDVLIRFHRNDGTAREVVATYLDGFSAVSLATAGSRESLVPLVFEAFEPYWRSTEEVEYDILATEFIGGGEPTDFNSAAVAFNAAIPFNGFNETGFQYFEVDLSGDVEAWPRWEIVGPAEQVTAVNLTTGKKWSYELALDIDAPLSVDTRPNVRRVVVNDSNVFPSLTDDSELWPLVPGRNFVGLRVTEWDPAHSKMLLSWRERYLTC